MALSLRLDPELYERVRLQAFATKTTITELLRTAITYYFTGTPELRLERLTELNESVHRSHLASTYMLEPVWLEPTPPENR